MSHDRHPRVPKPEPRGHSQASGQASPGSQDAQRSQHWAAALIQICCPTLICCISCRHSSRECGCRTKPAARVVGSTARNSSLLGGWRSKASAMSPTWSSLTGGSVLVSVYLWRKVVWEDSPGQVFQAVWFFPNELDICQPPRVSDDVLLSEPIPAGGPDPRHHRTDAVFKDGPPPPDLHPHWSFAARASAKR